MAAINTIHLVDDNFRVRIDAQNLGIHRKRDLDCFEEDDLLGDVVAGLNIWMIAAMRTTK